MCVWRKTGEADRLWPVFACVQKEGYSAEAGKGRKQKKNVLWIDVVG
jgi:hypothetical protein